MLTQTDLFEGDSFSVDWKHVTHAGGKGEYLHDWYAYLEGYSSEFVRKVRAAYLPSSSLIIDPFAGIGTTPITLGLEGIGSSYCELNPAMRKVICAKLTVAALPEKKKRELCTNLIALVDNLPDLVAEKPKCDDLQIAYIQAFNSSVFFYPETYDQVLRLRSLNDELSKSNHLLGLSLQVAVMSKLVECSKLKRAGDVRYKTEKELAKGVPELVPSVSGQLKLMAEDCLRCPQTKTPPQLLANNAKDLINLPSINADGVITSPPYLNGTNYFRNTKLELWYVRDLLGPECMRRFRDDVITSGINDVTKEKGNIVLAQAKDVHTKLVEGAYDTRIAKMVAGYFEEMGITLSGLAHHLKDGSIACIDIGDSVYAGIHVKTHDILASVAEDHSFKTQEIVTLRERRSYDGTRLTQSLIILKKSKAPKIVKVTGSFSKEPTNQNQNAEKGQFPKWDVFKDTLIHMRHPYSKRNWGNSLHSVCSYQGKMKPALAYHLVEAFSSPGDKVLDPFSGSGTIPFEAALNGRSALGLDISLLATSLSNAKLMNPDQEDVDRLLNSLEQYLSASQPTKMALKDADEVRFNKTIPEYFHEDTLREILCARDFFQHQQLPNDPAWSLVFSCMLHILHGNRPYALSRRSHPITPYAPTGDFEYRNLMERLRAKVQRSMESDRGPEFISGTCFQADILAEWPESIQQVDAIITSPPFFDSTKFYMTNWMRYWFCGWGRKDFDEQPKSFVEVIQRKNFDAYDFIFQQCHDRLSDNGVAVFHLGYSDKCDMATELQPYAKKYFDIRDVFVESVEHCESHGIKDKGRVKSHQYVVLQKN